MKLVFTWIQGCGKWTQARLLWEKYWFELVEMWWELRKVIASGSELWKRIKEVIDAGYLVDDKLGWEVMKGAIDSYKENENVIFDAFIRLEWNKKLFDEYLPEYKVVFFNLPIEKAKERLLWRMYDKATWETFPAGTFVNPKTWWKLVKRDDDKDEKSILKRFSEFEEKTLKMVKIQREEWKVIDVNADQSIEDVFSELEEKLGL